MELSQLRDHQRNVARNLLSRFISFLLIFWLALAAYWKTLCLSRNRTSCILMTVSNISVKQLKARTECLFLLPDPLLIGDIEEIRLGIILTADCLLQHRIKVQVKLQQISWPVQKAFCLCLWVMRHPYFSEICEYQIL